MLFPAPCRKVRCAAGCRNGLLLRLKATLTGRRPRADPILLHFGRATMLLAQAAIKRASRSTRTRIRCFFTIGPLADCGARSAIEGYKDLTSRPRPARRSVGSRVDEKMRRSGSHRAQDERRSRLTYHPAQPARHSRPNLGKMSRAAPTICAASKMSVPANHHSLSGAATGGVHSCFAHCVRT